MCHPASSVHENDAAGDKCSFSLGSGGITIGGVLIPNRSAIPTANCDPISHN